MVTNKYLLCGIAIVIFTFVFIPSASVSAHQVKLIISPFYYHTLFAHDYYFGLNNHRYSNTKLMNSDSSLFILLFQISIGTLI